MFKQLLRLGTCQRKSVDTALRAHNIEFDVCLSSGVLVSASVLVGVCLSQARERERSVGLGSLKVRWQVRAPSKTVLNVFVEYNLKIDFSASSSFLLRSHTLLEEYYI